MPLKKGFGEYACLLEQDSETQKRYVKGIDR